MHCLFCNTRTRRKDQKYCSIPCQHLHRFGELRITCEVCGKLLSTKAAKRGRRLCPAIECRNILFSGNGNPFFGNTHSKEEKNRMSNRMVLRNIKFGNPFKGKSHSEATRIKMRESHKDFTGENNPNWKGGIATTKAYPRAFIRARGIVGARDGHRCTECGKSRGKLETHHKDGNIHNNLPNNLLTLCSKCHIALRRQGTVQQSESTY